MAQQVGSRTAAGGQNPLPPAALERTSGYFSWQVVHKNAHLRQFAVSPAAERGDRVVKLTGIVFSKINFYLCADIELDGRKRSSAVFLTKEKSQQYGYRNDDSGGSGQA